MQKSLVRGTGRAARHNGANPTVTAIVVSEETGIITAVYDRQIKRYLDGQNLTKALQYAYNMELPSSRDTFWGVDGHAE